MAYFIAISEILGLNVILALSVFATLMVGQFSLAQVGCWSIGAFVTAILTTMHGFPIYYALLVSGAVCAVVGIFLGYPCLRIKGIYLTLATVAFAEVVRVFFNNLNYQVEIDGKLVGPAGAVGFRGVKVLAAWPEIYISLSIIILVFVIISSSRFGLSVNAVREDEVAAASLGINVTKVKVLMFIFGAAIAGVGEVYAHLFLFVLAENFGFHLALSIFYVAVGGMCTFYGPIINCFVNIITRTIPFCFRLSNDPIRCCSDCSCNRISKRHRRRCSIQNRIRKNLKKTSSKSLKESNQNRGTD